MSSERQPRYPLPVRQESLRNRRMQVPVVPSFVARGATVPAFIYGTAWKEQRTAELTGRALEAGFRGFDTANQRRHYLEAGVGEAVAAFIAAGRVKREELFLQTKFTFAAGQDHRLPYDPRAPVAEQVQQSFSSSLEHLRTGKLDSYVLHGPSRARGLGAEDWEAWRAMEALCGEGKVTSLGISNVNAEQLQLLLRGCRVAPAFVQNRCYASAGWGANVRLVCQANGIVYQGFSLLTGNHAELHDPRLTRIARDLGRSVAQVVFRFATQVGMIPLTGSSNSEHLREDVACFGFELTPQHIELIESISN